MEILLRHTVQGADDLSRRLSDLTTDPRVTEHIDDLKRHKSGLAYRFSGPRIASGELAAQVAAAAPGFIALTVSLSGLACLFEGAIERTIREVAAEVLGPHLLLER